MTKPAAACSNRLRGEAVEQECQLPNDTRGVAVREDDILAGTWSDKQVRCCVSAVTATARDCLPSTRDGCHDVRRSGDDGMLARQIIESRRIGEFAD